LNFTKIAREINRRPSSTGHLEAHCRDRNSNRNLKTSKALLKSQAYQGSSLFTSAATNQRGFPRGWSREAQVRFPEGHMNTKLENSLQI